MPRASERDNPPRNRRERPGAGLVEATQGSPSCSRVFSAPHTSLSRTTRTPLPRPSPALVPSQPPCASPPPPPLCAPGTRSRTLRRLHQSRAGGSAEQPPLPPPRWSSASPPGPALPVPVPRSSLPALLPPPSPAFPSALSGCSPRPARHRAGRRAAAAPP